jgi:hypothetical protein
MSMINNNYRDVVDDDENEYNNDDDYPISLHLSIFVDYHYFSSHYFLNFFSYKACRFKRRSWHREVTICKWQLFSNIMYEFMKSK